MEWKKNCERNVNVCHAEFRSFCSRSVLIEVPNSISLVYFRWLLQILPLACPSVGADVFYFLGFFSRRNQDTLHHYGQFLKYCRCSVAYQRNVSPRVCFFPRRNKIMPWEEKIFLGWQKLFKYIIITGRESLRWYFFLLWWMYWIISCIRTIYRSSLKTYANKMWRHTLKLTYPRCSCTMIKGLRSDPAAPKNGRKFIITQTVVLDFPRYYWDKSVDLCLLGGEIQFCMEDQLKSCACLNTTRRFRRRARSFGKHSFKGLSGAEEAQRSSAKDSVFTLMARRRVSSLQSAPRCFFMLSFPLHKCGICWSVKEMSKLRRMKPL